jgi:hypothetical protein
MASLKIIYSSNYLRFLAALRDLKLSAKLAQTVVSYTLKDQLKIVPFIEWPPLIYQCIHLSRKRKLIKAVIYLLSCHFLIVEKAQLELGETTKNSDYKNQNVEATVLMYITFALKQDHVTMNLHTKNFFFYPYPFRIT